MGYTKNLTNFHSFLDVRKKQFQQSKRFCTHRALILSPPNGDEFEATYVEGYDNQRGVAPSVWRDKGAIEAALK
jgi:hypothetical protein